MTKRYVANVSPCKTPARILKVSVSPSGVLTLAVVSSYSSYYSNSRHQILRYSVRFCVVSIFSLYMVSMYFLKSMNIRIDSRLLSLTPSISRMHANILLVVVLSLLKPYLFFFRIPSR